MRPRITIARLIAAIAFIGVGLAAVRSATELWASVVFSATLLVFALAATYAAQRRGPRRAFWTAFVVFGVGYLMLAFGPWCETTIRPRLLTTKLLDRSYLWLTLGNPDRYSHHGPIDPLVNLDPTVRLCSSFPENYTPGLSVRSVSVPPAPHDGSWGPLIPGTLDLTKVGSTSH